MSVNAKNQNKKMSAAAAVTANTKSNLNSNRSTTTAKYCDVCYGAGKTYAEYTSHFVKSNVGPTGVVTCPTILNSICTYCKTKGHFKSACEVLKAKNAKMAAAATVADAIAAKSKTKSSDKKRQRNGDIITKNTFDCLRDCCDDDDDDDDSPLHVPALVRTNPPNIIPVRVFECSAMGSVKMSYVQALASSSSSTNDNVKTSNAKGKSLMNFLKPNTSSQLPLSLPSLPLSLPSLVEVDSLSTPIGNALHHFVNNTVPPLVTLRRSSHFQLNPNGTRKSWADYDSDSSEGEDEDE